ncbi:SPOR domain-containing protein [Acinetobacter sp. B5B]|uniref:SPOR domain-containing protein n=1 Tax=Acinetobacter baretiae TaxID=2605383 RepID=UPI0018C33852|nr:SPOR domain-containing protein [Acinetobacter baretiae]MBF7682355.1 SPOR domain-containing protein [Acinetobacter baretiae]
MSMNNKQRWMGGVVLLGGSTLLAALLFKGAHEIKENQVQEGVKPASQVSTSKTSAPAKIEEMQSLQPVTVDIETEKRLLEEQKRTREKVIADQEEKTQKYLAQQQLAEAAAAKKAAQEYAQINARRAKEQAAVNMPPDATTTDSSTQPRVDEKKQALEAKQKADLEKKAEAKKQAELKEKERKNQALEDEKKEKERKRQALESEKKAEQELKKKADREQAKKEHEEKLKAQTQKQEVKQKDKDPVETDTKHKIEQSHMQTQNELDHKKKADADKAREIMKDDSSNKKWMVQVALAGNQANADAIIAKLKAKGYKTTTSPTSKGIRIMVGPSKNKDHADTLRKKIQTDDSLNMPSAWVIDWVPLEER